MDVLTVAWLTHSCMHTVHTAHFERGLELQEDWLAQKHLARHNAQPLDLLLRQIHCLAGAAAADCGGNWDVSEVIGDIGMPAE
jgi:hypothetical protein